MPETKNPAAKGTRTKAQDVDAKEEPELTQEESVPLDGKDEVGERLMDELGQERRSDEKERSS